MVKSSYNKTPKDTKSIIKKAVVFPLVAGIIIALLTVTFGFGGSFFDVPSGLAISYFDGENGGKQIAQMSYSGSENGLSVTDGYDYSALKNGACHVKGSRFGEVGAGYYLTLQNNIKDLNKQKITVSADGKTFVYKYMYSFTAESENEVLCHTVNVGKGIVLYSQNVGEYGFSSGYTALVYEEVAE